MGALTKRYGVLSRDQDAITAVPLILIDGNPLEDIHSLKRNKVDSVMKDGVVYQNWLPDKNAPAFRPAQPSREADFGSH